MNIKQARISKEGLEILFEDNSKDCFPFLWLRDNAQDDSSWDHRSNQRKLFTAEVDPNISIDKAKVINEGKNVLISWPDISSPIQYSSDFLTKFSLTDTPSSPYKRIPWEKDTIDNEKIYIDYSSIFKKNGLSRLLEEILKQGFAIINNCPRNISAVEKITKKIGYVRNSIFGGLWSFESNDSMADSAYTQEELRPHTDGTYCHDAPGLQILLCCEYDASGGESIMVDGFKIAEVLKVEDEETYKILTEIEVPGNYIGDGVCLEARRPVFKLSLDGKISQVSFNNYDRGVFRLNNQTGMQLYKAIRSFDKLANNRKMQWRKILEPGEMLIFDNWRVMHGRGEFTGKRKMSGCYINREDFESSCRMHNLSI